MKNFFYKGAIDKRNGKALFEFLNNHYKYYTMNSWNGLESIANKVKIYELGLEGDKWLALGILQNDNYECLNNMIYDWEGEHPNYEVGFNGRSGGYLVLTNKENNLNILPDWIRDYDNYEDFKANVKDYYGSIKEALGDLNYYVELIQSFDKLCDEIREYVNELSLTNKDEMVKEEIKRFVENFNWQYGEDLNTMNIDELKVKKDENGYYVNINQLTKSNSLMDNFETQLRDYDNAISLYKVNWNDNIFRLEYNG